MINFAVWHLCSNNQLNHTAEKPEWCRTNMRMLQYKMWTLGWSLEDSLEMMPLLIFCETRLVIFLNNDSWTPLGGRNLWQLSHFLKLVKGLHQVLWIGAVRKVGWVYYPRQDFSTFAIVHFHWTVLSCDVNMYKVLVASYKQRVQT